MKTCKQKMVDVFELKFKNLRTEIILEITNNGEVYGQRDRTDGWP